MAGRWSRSTRARSPYHDLMPCVRATRASSIYDLLCLRAIAMNARARAKSLMRADVARAIEGRPVPILDDVFDSGRTIAYARAHLMAKGRRRRLLVRSCASLWPGRSDRCNRLDAPGDFLVGYGMDDGGRYRGFAGT